MNTIFKRLDLWITAVIFILMLGAERFELLPRIENPLIGLRHEFRTLNSSCRRNGISL